MLSRKEIKWINALKNKKYRYIERAYIAEGPRLVDDLLFNGETALKIFKTEKCSLSSEINSADLQVVTEAELKKITALKKPHEVLGVFKMPSPVVTEPHPEGQWGLALEFIQDPGNLGTILRSMDWLGLKHLYCSSDTVDMYNPKVVQAAMGSTARVQVSYVDLPVFLGSCKSKKYAADMKGKPVHELDLKPGLLVFGNEGNGLSMAVSDLCEETVSVARLGGGESLNVAVSASIMAAFVSLRP